ncbi:aldo/keto reductase [Pelobacter seleniigenes]|uniref:aldo/keto reductase n=1 Tax=Pelobacter seleniigenes TaxID=407188 RepID=UPI0004A76CCF|nr:aldo/keto reductase [Pelobacter seleniigenes]
MNTAVRIGKTDLFVNPIGLGANAVGGHNLYPDLDEEVGRELVRQALAGGINFIDTAFIYGPRRSEELIGEVIKTQHRRADVVIATKGAHDLSSGEVKFNNRPEFLKQSVDSSLQRLQTDYIDLYYIHYPDEDTPKDEAVGMLKELKQAGKIRAIGVSNFSLGQLEQGNKYGGIDVFQGHYNLLTRGVEQDILPYCEEQEISFVPYFPLAMGILAGKYHKDTVLPAGDHRNKRPLFQPEVFPAIIAKVDQLRELAERYATDVPYLVLAWYLTRPAIDVLIPGAKRAEQALQNLQTLELQLAEEDIAAIDKMFQDE